MDAGIVEEVVPVALSGARGGVHDDARRDRLEGESVVDLDRDPHGAAGLRDAGEVGLERRIPALVRGDLDAVGPHGRAVRDSFEGEGDAAVGPARRDPDLGLVPGGADVVAQCGIDEDVVVARGHGHLAGLGQRGVLPLLGAADAVGVDAEAPQAVEQLALAGGVVLGAQHEGSFWGVLSVFS